MFIAQRAELRQLVYLTDQVGAMDLSKNKLAWALFFIFNQRFSSVFLDIQCTKEMEP